MHHPTIGNNTLNIAVLKLIVLDLFPMNAGEDVEDILTNTHHTNPLRVIAWSV
jgi:hypothetical protein